MQNELEQLVDLPEGKLVFTNEQIQFLFRQYWQFESTY